MTPISQPMLDIITCLPGYDPLRDAEGCTFDEKLAWLAIEFYPDMLTHVTGPLAGKPYELEPHEQAIVANLMGWKRPDGTRRYRSVFYFVPRGNSKSTFGAGLIIMIPILCPSAMNAQVVSTASSRDQTRFVRDPVEGMIRNSAELYKACVIYQSAIKMPDCSYKHLAAKVNSAHGMNLFLVVNDEIHAHATRDFLDVVDTSMGKHPQPIKADITTSDFVREGSICNERYDYAVKVRDGEIFDPSHLPVIFEVPPDVIEKEPECWKDPKWWRHANPLLGKAIPLDYFEHAVAKAIESPALENEFKRLHLNIRTETAERLIGAEQWALGDGPLDITIYEGKQVAGAGLDIGSTSDLTALCLLFDNDDGGYDAFWWHWAPEAKAREREKLHRFPYLTVQRQGWLTLTPGNETDYGQIEREIDDIGSHFGIKDLAIDRNFQGAQLAQRLTELGFEMTAFAQTAASMTAPMQEALLRINRGELKHGDNPLMRWQAGNVMATFDSAGNMRPDKGKSGNKIDGFVAFIMAIGQAMGRDRGGSVYDEGELLVL